MDIFTICSKAQFRMLKSVYLPMCEDCHRAVNEFGLGEPMHCLKVEQQRLEEKKVLLGGVSSLKT